MRELKFRGWDGYKMRSWEDIKDCLGFHHWIFNTPKDVKMMQYTGLKCKDGTEIYESDIIKFLGNWDSEGKVIPATNELYQVSWSMGGFHAVPIVPSIEADSAKYWKGVGHTNSILVGNIYEGYIK